MFNQIATQADQHGLMILGHLNPSKHFDGETAQTLVLLGPGQNFWPVFQQSAEYRDQGRDPIDRWTQRVFDNLATQLDARAVLPFGGPPYAPFLDYAKLSGRAWNSEMGMLIHDTQGLMISYRGALAFDVAFDEPAPARSSPCLSCLDKPCRSACPVDAFATGSYDVPKCKEFLKSHDGKDCMAKGCAVRRICPISVGAGRHDAQSALHMRAFRGD